jgi:hypothetical protein
LTVRRDIYTLRPARVAGGAYSMFREKTVFVLGAGASWHYGYPTGEGLVENIISMAERLSAYCEARLGCGQVVQVIPDYVNERMDSSQGIHGAVLGWERVRNECKLFVDRLKSVRPILIDHFLAWNESLREIGKLLIAATILECEANWLRLRANANRRSVLTNTPIKPSDDELKRLDITKYHDDWYRFLVHKLVYGCQISSHLFFNNVRFLTFNYDTSLKYCLYRALSSLDLLEQADVDKFLTDDRIAHIYGSVHQKIPTEVDAIDFAGAQNLGQPFKLPLDHAKEFLPRKMLLDQCLEASQNLRTIDPQDKEENQEILSLARRWMQESKVVYVLGYGFDQNNNQRIGLDPFLDNKSSPSSGKTVMFTNYRNMNTVNKTVSRLCYGNYDTFLGDRFVYGNPAGGNYVEKSTGDVYEALERDFYALEG